MLDYVINHIHGDPIQWQEDSKVAITFRCRRQLSSSTNWPSRHCYPDIGGLAAVDQGHRPIVNSLSRLSGGCASFRGQRRSVVEELYFGWGCHVKTGRRWILVSLLGSASFHHRIVRSPPIRSQQCVFMKASAWFVASSSSGSHCMFCASSTAVGVNVRSAARRCACVWSLTSRSSRLACRSVCGLAALVRLCIVLWY
eukprot:SAG31_NODE_7050_length_1803_cov_3.078638_1_plen_198_part_00